MSSNKIDPASTTINDNKPVLSYLHLDSQLIVNESQKRIWRTPSITRIEIKRTMAGSGIMGDGANTSHS